MAERAATRTAEVVTDDEDSADNAASGKLHAALTMDPRVAPLHSRVTYPKELHVGHAMTDPENYPNRPAGQPASNMLFRTLYQESFRFFTTGRVSQENLLRRREQDSTLPPASCVTPDYPERCN